MKFLERYTLIGEQQKWRGITVRWLQSPGGERLKHGFASGNLTRGKLVISETGTVAVAKFQSTSSMPTLVPEGTRLIGGRQDRMVNTSVLVPAHSTVPINVTCVESNRWRERPGVDVNQFSLGKTIVPSSLRGVLKRTTNVGHVANQSAVWASVSQTVTNMSMTVQDFALQGAGTLTQAFQALKKVEAFDESEALDALRYAEGANGVAIAIGPNLRTIDFFNNYDKMGFMWKQLVGGHFVERDALIEGEAFDDRHLKQALAAMLNSRWEEVNPAAAGAEGRCVIEIANESGRASCLKLDRSLVHASLVMAN